MKVVFIKHIRNYKSKMGISLQNSHLGRLCDYLSDAVIASNILGIPLLKSPS